MKAWYHDITAHYSVMIVCFREGSIAGRSIATSMSVMEGRGGSTRVMMKNRSSTRASVALHQGDLRDEETTVVLLDQVTQDANNHGLQKGRSSRRLANKFLQHYKGVLSNAASVQTHI